MKQKKKNYKRRIVSIALAIIGISIAHSFLQPTTDNVDRSLVTTTRPANKATTSSSSHSSSSTSTPKKDNKDEQALAEEKKKAEVLKRQQEEQKAEEERKAEEARQLAIQAENTVKNLEDNQVNENIPSAQESVDKIADLIPITHQK